MSEETDKKSHTGLIAGISAALAAGAVYFYGPNSDKHREELHGWMVKTKGEVLEELEGLEEVSREKYDDIVDAAVTKFAAQKVEKEAKIKSLREELKGEWEAIKALAEEKGGELRESAAKKISQKGEEPASDIEPDEK